MEQISEEGSFSLLRTRTMRNGALAFSAYMLLMSINGVIEPEPNRRGYLTLFPPNVFPWVPPTVVWALNIAFWAYLIWFFISLIRVSRSGEERLIMVAVATSFGFGFLTNVPNSATTAIAQYGDVGIWAIATAAAGRLVVAHADGDQFADAVERFKSGDSDS